MSQINELSEIIKSKIKNYELKIDKSEEGVVISTGDGISMVAGLKNTRLGELLKFENGETGMALLLEEDYIGVVLFSSIDTIKEGTKVQRTNKVVEVPVGDELLGRVVNSLGVPLDGQGEIKSKKFREIERVAPGVMTREEVNVPMETGILAIDSIVPIGRGQRELIIGDRKTGKTAIAIDAIINQKSTGVHCVYTSIGQKNSTLAKTIQRLKDYGAIDHTTVVAADASDADSLQYLAPYAAITIAEEWMEQGKDVLVVFDDLSKHAVAYRTLSLLLKRPPGREAYPGDVFYLHSRLLERSARLNKDNGGGSITALPIIETLAGDISAYISTNVISITDGQIFLMSGDFNSGQRPAVDAGLSVSRVGGTAQTKLIKALSSTLKLDLASYNELKVFAEFSSDLDAETKQVLDNGERIRYVLRQTQFNPYSEKQKALLLFVIKYKLFGEIEVQWMKEYIKQLVDGARTGQLAEIKKIIGSFESNAKISDQTVEALKKAIKEFNTKFIVKMKKIENK